MNKLLSFILTAIVLAAFAGCSVHVSNSPGWSDSDLKEVTNVVQSAAIPAGLKNLEVDNRSGAVRVTGTESGSTSWTWKLKIRARTDAAAQLLASTASCKAEFDGDRLKLVFVPPDSNEPHTFQSEFEITVPKAVSVRTENHYGATAISDVGGGVEVTGQSGSVEIRNVGGRVRAQNSYGTLKVSNTGAATLKNQSGSIEAIGIRGPLVAETSYASLVARGIDGPVKLRNQSGRIEVERAGDADIKTSYAALSVKEINGDALLVNQSGSVKAEGITGSVKASTTYASMDIAGSGSNFVCDNQSGRILLRAKSVTLAEVQARTSYAPLEVRLPAALKPAIQARTSYAEVESDFPVLLKPRGQDAFADLPPGTPRISLQNQSGKIRVLRE